MAMNSFSSDRASMSSEINRLQSQFQCKYCKQRYEKPWCKADDSICFFCTHFNPKEHTRHFILRESEWHFIRSGEEDRGAYNRQYIYQLHKWCNRHHIPLTAEEANFEDELCHMGSE
jgi:hypothetical protein